MEIEKTRETSWKIHLKKESDIIEITSVEVSGEVRAVKLALKDKNNTVNLEMSKNEFFNFLSLISAFRDVIIGEEPNILKDQVMSTEKYEETHKIDSIDNDNDQNSYSQDNNEESDDLNPEEWDPW